MQEKLKVKAKTSANKTLKETIFPLATSVFALGIFMLFNYVTNDIILASVAPNLVTTLIGLLGPIILGALVLMYIPAIICKKAKSKKIKDLLGTYIINLKPALMVFWISFVIMAAQVLCTIIIVVANHGELDSPLVNAIYQAVVYLISLIIITKVTPLIEKETVTNREELGLTGLPTWTDVGLAPVSFIVYLFAAAFVTTIAQKIINFDMNQAQDVGFNVLVNQTDRIIAFIALVIVAPIAEEIIFRGWLYGKVRKKFSMPFAVLIVSVFFGLMHGQWNVGVNVFVMSIFLCLQREITGTIYSGILMHMIKNAVAYLVLYVFTF